MTEQQVQNIIKQTLMSSTNMIVPRHIHNGVDMLRINSYDIATSNPQGFVFQFGSTVKPVNIFADIPNNQLYITANDSPPMIDFNVGIFKNIFIVAGGTDPSDFLGIEFDNGTQSGSIAINDTFWTAGFNDGTDTVDYSIIGTKAFYTATGDFALGLPDLLGLPATCNTGELTVSGGGLYLCSPTNTWTLVTTSTTNGIVSINADTTQTQTLSVGTAGTDFAIVDAGGGSHVFNLPTASATNRGALSSADWTTFNNKLSSSLTTNHIFIGVAGIATDVAMSGDATIVASGALTLATVNGNVGTFGSAIQVGVFTVNAKGLITAASNASITGFTSSTLTNAHIFVGNVSNVATDVAMSGDVTIINTGATTLKANKSTQKITFVFLGFGSTAVTGSGTPITFPYAGTIVGWSIAATGASPTCTLDVWKIAAGTALPTVSNTIMGTKPALSSGNAVQSTTLTSWTTSVAKNDIWIANVDAVANATGIVLTIEILLS